VREILCENGTESVITLQYIIGLQPLYARTLRKHHINNEVMKKNPYRVLLSHKPRDQHIFAYCNHE